MFSLSTPWLCLLRRPMSSGRWLNRKVTHWFSKGVNSITCWVATKASKSKAGLQSTINHDIEGLSQKSVNLGFKTCVNGQINTQMSRLRIRYVCPHKSTGLCLCTENAGREGNFCHSDTKPLSKCGIALGHSPVLSIPENETGNSSPASSICDVPVTHSCSCYCRPARHPCLKDSLSPSRIPLFLEGMWSHPCGAKGQKLAVQLRPVGMFGAVRKRTVLGRSGV